MKHLNIVNPQSFIKAIEDFNCGNTAILKIDAKDFEIPQNETAPLEGFIFPENFPDCCESHRQVLNDSIKLLNEFPDCCKGHKKLISQVGLKRVTTIIYQAKFLRHILIHVIA
ncbi:MAG: hypothetical protein K2X48_12995 [Chitinophagaceae bacterium]|nr:hypothetical protein [Chitinophagaceae bacterium]